MFNPSQRFLHTELERIQLELHRIEMDDNASTPAAKLYEEFQRRYDIISDLLPHAGADAAVLAALDARIRDTHMLCEELVRAGRDDVSDVMVDALAVDLEYMDGLRARLMRHLEDYVVVYALAGVERL